GRGRRRGRRAPRSPAPGPGRPRVGLAGDRPGGADRRRSRDRLSRRRLRQGERGAPGGAAGRHPAGTRRPRRRRRGQPRGHRRHRARGGPPVHQPALPAQTGRASRDPGGLMASGVTTTSDGPVGKTSEGVLERRRRPQKKREPRRWLREVKAILLLTGAGFGAVALWNHTRVSELEVPVCLLVATLGWLRFALIDLVGVLLP